MQLKLKYFTQSNATISRVLVIALVFERISNTNRKRTVRLEAPMDHKEIEDELKICLREHGLPENPPAITDGKIPKIQPDQLALVSQPPGQPSHSRCQERQRVQDQWTEAGD